MILHPHVPDGRDPSAPRSRGDDPNYYYSPGIDWVVLPAHAGMIPIWWKPALRLLCAPRSRGDDPSREG